MSQRVLKGPLQYGTYCLQRTNTILEQSTPVNKIFKECGNRAKVYHLQTSGCTVTILDHINHLAVVSLSILYCLQDLTKNSTYNRVFKILFINSEGHRPIQFLRIILLRTLMFVCF